MVKRKENTRYQAGSFVEAKRVGHYTTDGAGVYSLAPGCYIRHWDGCYEQTTPSKLGASLGASGRGKMQIVGSQRREDISKTEYTLIRKHGKEAILHNRDTGKRELWYSRDDYAGYVVAINGTGYEFGRELKGEK